MPKQALGRGLGSLIPQKVQKITTSSKGEAVVSILTEKDKKQLIEIDPKLIEANPLQPRKQFAQKSLDDLMLSIRRYGLIQPLVVTQKDDKYELIAGERRLRASLELGLKKVPVVIRDAKDQEKLELALIENIQREDLDPIETALAYRKLIDQFNLTQEELSKRVGKSRPVITNSLRLLNLPEKIQEALVKGHINEGHAKLIAGLPNEVKQMQMLRRIIDGKLSVGATLKETRKTGGTKEARVKINAQDKENEMIFRDFFGARAEINRNAKGGGRIVIEFYGEEDLDEMIKKIK